MRGAWGRLRAEQDGVALIAALLLMVCMGASGLALASIVDQQTSASQEQRQRETSFNLAEAALTAQVVALARDWPGRGRASNPYPRCTPSSSATQCPDGAQLASMFPTADGSGASWVTELRDNGGGVGSAYTDSTAASQPGYDANGDGRLWVRAQALAQGKRRTLVALVRAELQDEEVPRSAVLAGRLDLSNNGNKTIIDASKGGQVAVRCTPVLLEAVPCAGHRLGQGVTATLSDLTRLLQAQISPNVLTTNLPAAPAISGAARARLRARAIAEGTYYTGCPTAEQLTGAVVYIAAGSCSYTSNTVVNTLERPGTIIQESGSIVFNGTMVVHAVVHHANLANVDTGIVQVHGNAQVIGGVLVDGPGTLVAGSSKTNVLLNPNAASSAQSYGSAGVIQSTWREIRAG